MQENIIVKVGADITNFSRNIRKVSDSVSGLGKGFGGIADAGRRAASGVKEIVKAAGLLTIAYKGIDMVKQSLDSAIDRYDTLNNFPRVMQQIGFDAKESSRAIQRLSDGIQGLPTPLDSVAKTTQRLALMTGDLDGAVETTLALNNAFLASGASAADAERGLEQYVQMLATGAVDLQSWRTLQETMPIALNKTAEAFGFAGKSAQNDLYNALKSGEITFEDFNNKLVELNDGVGGFAELARKSTGGIKTSWQNVKTAVVRGVADVIGAIDEALGGTGSIARMFDNLKTVVQGFFSWVVSSIPKVAAAFSTVKDAIEAILSPSVFEWLNAFVTGFMNVFNTIKSFVVPILTEVGAFILAKINELKEFWDENGAQIIAAVQNFFSIIAAIVEFFMPAIKAVIETVWGAIKNIVGGALDVIMGLLKIFTGIFTGDWSKLWEGIKQLFIGAIDFIAGLMTLNFFGGIKKILTNLLKNGVSIVKNLWTNIVNMFKNAGTNATNTVSGMVTRVVGFFGNLFTKAKNIFTMLRTFGASIWNALKEAVLGAARSIWQGVVSRFSSMASSVRNLMHNVKSAIISIWNQAVKYLKSINLTSVGKNIIRGLIRGITGMASAVVDAVRNIGKKITGGIKKILGIASPSKVMRDDVGRWIPAGIVEGINGMKSDVIGAAQQMAKWATPDVPAVSISYSTPSGIRGSLDSAVRGTVDVESRDEMLAKLVNALSTDRPIILNMDGYTVAKGQAPYLDVLMANNTELKLYMKGVSR